MKKLNLHKIHQWHQHHKENSLFGRWVPFSKIEPILHQLNSAIFETKNIGSSVQNRPIHKISIGSGEIRVLIWTQMHGNETTGTKAVFDFFKFLEQTGEFDDVINEILTSCTITVIPILNPDGAQVYTRVNADGIDLNRDAVDLIAPESKILNAVLNDVNPHYCFNLHDQRTIFTVGNTKEPATLSFLAPSIDVSREITSGRKKTMRVIASINETMQELIPGRVGRYTDEFYPSATGDNFEKAGHHTILIEAGHSVDDYDREQVRYYNFIALLKGLYYISNDLECTYDGYLDIPNNTKFFLDIIYKNVYIEDEKKMVTLGVLFKEVLKEGEVCFIPEIQQIDGLELFGANTIIDKKGIHTQNRETLKEIINS